MGAGRLAALVLAVPSLLIGTACAPTTPISGSTLMIRQSADSVQTIVQAPSTIGVADSDLYGQPEDQVDRALDRVAAVGITTVRLMVPWAGVEARPNVYDWKLVDRTVNAAAARGLTVLATLNATPAWATTPGTPMLSGRPKATSDYGRFAGAVAARYRGKISAYEIWNEPNASFFYKPNPDPAGYTQLLKSAYPAIKTADPTAIVVTGGLGAIVDHGAMAVDAVKFVKGMYAAGAADYFDALGYHPYQYTMMFSDGDYHPDSPTNQLANIRQVMLDNEDRNKKIWATEYGEPSSIAGETAQATFLADMLKNWKRLPYAGPVYVYTVRDRNSSSAESVDTLGLFRSDGTPKPALDAVEVALRDDAARPPSQVLGTTPPPR